MYVTVKKSPLLLLGVGEKPKLLNKDGKTHCVCARKCTTF